MFFGSVKLNKNADIDKYKYSGYGIRFDKGGSFSFSTGGFGCDVDNKKKDILILGEGLTQGLDDATLNAEKDYAINFTLTRKKFSWSKWLLVC